ncbi:MAG: sigma factor, partial [Planctomycetota bacterium]
MTEESIRTTSLTGDDLALHLPALRRFARALAGDDGDDLVQDAFLAATRTTRPVRDTGAFLRSVVRRRSVD